MTGWESLDTPLVLLVGGPLLALWLGWVLRRRRHRVAPAFWLAATALLLLLAAAGPRSRLSQTGRTVLLLLDVSPSLPAGVRDAAVRRAETLLAGQDGALHWLAFGRETRRVGSSAELAAVAATGLPGPTDLTRALDTARELLSEGGRVLLLSDGRHAATAPGETATAPLAAASALARQGSALHVMPLWPAEAPDVALHRLLVPRSVGVRTSAPVTVLVSCRGQVEPASHQIRLLLAGQPLRSLPLAIPCDGQPHPLRTQVEFPEPGRPLLEAERIGPGADLVVENDRAGSVVQVQGPAAVLWVGDPAAGQPIRELLQQDGHELRLLLPEQLTASAGELATHDLVVLDDVAAHRLPVGEDAALAGYVRSGGGLLVLGGPAAFGAGGYPGTQLDELLPVASDPHRGGGRLAVILLIDKSGSMGGYEEGWERLLLAKETLRSLLNSLGRPEDDVGILGFDTETRVILPMTRVARLDLEGLDTGEIRAGGGTDPTDALQAAALELELNRAPLRHIIVITDGRFAGPRVEEEVRGLIRRGIRVSTIAVGATAEVARLERLATLGQGGYSRVLEARHLPRALLRELLEAAGGVIRQELVAVEPGSGLGELAAEVPLPIPPVQGLNRTLPREGALRWLQSPVGEPVLTAIRRDAGLAIAFTSAPGRWTPAWQGWNGTTPLWRAVIDAAARRPSRPWEAQATAEGEWLRLELDAIQANGLPLSGHAVRGRVIEPGGQVRDVQLTERHPGGYQGWVPAVQAGRYRIAFHVGATQVAQADAVLLTPAEVRAVGNDLPLLETLATLGGGKLLQPGEPLPPAGPGREIERSLIAFPLSAALLTFLAYLLVEGRQRRGTRNEERGMRDEG